MKPEADRGDAPRSALSTSRTSGWSVRSFTATRLRGVGRERTNDPSGQTAASDLGRNAGRDVLGSTAVYRHRREGRPLDSPPGASGRPREALGGRGGSRTTERTQAHGRNERSRYSQGCRTQRTRSQRNASKSRASPDTPSLPPTSNGERGADRPGRDPTARGQRAAVTRYGCERGELFEGSRRREERGPNHPGTSADHPRVASARDPRGAGFSETRRTPRPAAGCNKPASLRAEKTVEVVRNHAGGTRLDGWCRRPDGRTGATRRSLEWTRGGDVGGGAVKSRTPGEAGPRAPGSSFGSGRNRREGPGCRADAS
jgi:hypothetical protein